MRTQTKTKCKQWIALLLCFCMIFSSSATAFAEKTSGTQGHVADGDTRYTYTKYLNDSGDASQLTTEYSGRVWADKTVSTEDITFEGGDVGTVRVENDSDFLVVYSALANTQQIIGQQQSPVDVVFVIDLSGSMITGEMNGKNRLSHAIDALNNSIKTLMKTNPNNRVGVVGYSNKSITFLNLGRYTAKNDKYFSYATNKKQTDSTTLLCVNCNVNETKETSSHNIWGQYATNTQMGLYTGMNLLAKETSTTVTIDGHTVRRTPALVHLSDGNPTVSSNSKNWWAPQNNFEDGRGATSVSEAGNGMKALMTGAYMKQQVNRKYSTDNNPSYNLKVYTIGMGLDQIATQDGGNAQHLANITLNPKKYLNANNTIAKEIKNSWNNYSNGKNVTVSFRTYPYTGIKNNNVNSNGLGSTEGVWRPNWDNTATHNYTFTHPSKNDIISLEYVDQYFTAQNADDVNDVFNNIISDIITSSPDVPTKDDPQNPSKSGYITYTDVIGDYMEVKDVKTLIFSGVNCSNPKKTENGNLTTYTFNQVIDSPIYGKHSASDIIIEVRSNTDSTGKMIQTLTVKIPASSIPLRVNTVKLNANGKVVSHTTNNAFPMRLCYTVGVQENVLAASGDDHVKDSVDLDKIDDTYENSHKDADGNLYLYSNQFTGNVKCESNYTAGDAQVTFDPDKSNPYFYVQEPVALYTDADCTKPLTTEPADNEIYYYKVQYYKGTQSITDKRSVIGVKGATEKINGSYFVKVGELNAPHIESKHYDKGTDDRTKTANLYYYVYTDDQKIAHIHLGNNGRLTMKPKQKMANLTISKVVSGDAGAKDTDWSFTVTLKDEEGKPLTGSYNYTGGTVADMTDVTKPDDGTLVLDEKGQTTFTLKHGQTITLSLPVGTTYEVTEQSADGYKTTSTGTTGTIQENQNSEAAFTNTQLVSISGKKIWDDNNNQDGKRPENLKVYLYADYGDGKLVKVDEQIVTPPASGNPNEWTWTFQALPKYHNGTLIQYSTEEENLGSLGYHMDSVTAGQDSDGGVTSLTITNKRAPEKTSITVRKIWDDDNNRDGIQPESITVKLLANGKQVQTTTLPNSEGRWIHTFQNLDKYENGTEIKYTVEEVGVDGYESHISEYDKDTGYTITNKHTPETIDISGSKIWEDDNNRDGLRPESITIRLYADGKEVKVLTVTEQDDWKWSFTGLPKYENGQEITYTIEEVPIKGYLPPPIGDIDNGFTITNRHIPATISLSGSKTWDDNNNQDGKRPESITIRLYADGKEVKVLTVTEQDDWKWSFTGLPKYENGKEITYTISEDKVTDYDDPIINGHNITNKHTPSKTRITVTKAWDDQNNQDGLRPSSITVELLANGIYTGQRLTLNAENNWTGSFDDLDEYANGKKIVYTISEVTVDGYETSITGNEEKGFVITNSRTSATIDLAGSKTWDDDNNRDGKRPESITIRLYADGKEVKVLTVTEQEDWKWSFTGLPKYAGGKEISYTITEDPVAGYEPEINGMNVTNRYIPNKISIPVTKFWQDGDNADSIRPNSITVKLYADGIETGKELILSSENNWTGSFDSLNEYANGKKIVYTIFEVTVDGYETSITGDAENGFVITNSHTSATIDLAGSKTWDDDNNKDGKRPESITIRLYADGKELNVITVTEQDNWKWSFTGLPKYADGKEISYTITEDPVAGYEPEINGMNVTNRYIPDKISIPVTKFWQDEDNADFLRPNSITVKLYADGIETGKELVLSSENNWTGSFDGLDEYANGEKIVYTIEEVNVDGYETSITGDAENGFVITNNHIPETIDISGSKTWEDDDNRDGKRPESITIRLYADGRELNVITVTEQDDWKWSFTGLPKYADGKEISYTISEDAIMDYSSTVNGYDIINSYTPDKTSIMVTKAWDDDNDRDHLRPSSITVKLLADGVDTGQILTLNAENNWTGTFTDLPKNNDGEPIVYSIEEVSVDGYETTITGDAEKGFVITNSYTPETIDISGSKTWEDENNRDGKRPESITILLYADGKEVKVLTVTEQDNWKWSFTGLPKYADGKEISYTIAEVNVDGYETSITGDAENGFVITNSHTPETIEISGFKTWDDNDNQDGKRPESITIRLYADGKELKVLTVTEQDDWKWSFTGLPKYADGKEISYTITEDPVTGYQTEIDGMNVTNRYIPGKIDIPVTKFWQDENNADSLRPDSITVKLYADGEETGKELILDSENNWTGSFDGLDEYASGKKIVYTIKEVNVDGYETSITGDAENGFVITNSHTPNKPNNPDPNPPSKPNDPDPNTPGKPNDPDQPQFPGSTPKSGDEAELMPWIALLSVSGAVLGAALILTVKKRRQQNNKRHLE